MKKYISFLLGIMLAISLAYAITLESVGNKVVQENQTLAFELNATGNTSQVIYGVETNATGYSFDVATGEFSWTPGFEAAGTYYANFTAMESANASVFASENITITVQDKNRLPVITTSAKTKAYLNKDYYYNVDANDPDGDELEYSLIQKPSGMTIDASNGLITWTAPADPQTVQVSVKAYEKDNAAAYDIQQYTLEVLEQPSRLRIIDGEVEVDGYDDYDDNLDEDGGTTFEAHPGDKVTISLDIENYYDEDIFEEELDLEDVYFELTIRDFEDEGDDDLELESDETDIRADDDETLSVEFDVPYSIEEQEYDVDIKVYGEDEEGEDYFVEVSYTLEIEKERHALLMKGADMFPQRIFAGESSRVTVMGTIQNIGSRDEDDVVLKIQSPDTDEFNFVDSGIELESDPYDSDNIYSVDKTFDVLIEEAGTYEVVIQGEIPGEDATVYQTFDLQVEERPKPPSDDGDEEEPQKNETEDDDTEIVFPDDEEEDEEEPPKEIVRETPFTETPMFIGILIGTAGLLVIILVLMLIVLAKK
jgi:hypothetical protein